MRLALVPLALVAGCELIGGNGGGGGKDVELPADTGYVHPPGVPADIECQPAYSTPAPGAAGLGECVTAAISCGETVQGTIEGGSTAFDNQYEHAFEWCSGHSTGDQTDGPERVYRLDVPANTRWVHPRLASCEAMQLLWYQTSEVCPSTRVNCSYVHVDGGTDQEQDILLGDSGVIWFVVEQLSGEPANFALTVDCGE